MPKLIGNPPKIVIDPVLADMLNQLVIAPIHIAPVVVPAPVPVIVDLFNYFQIPQQPAPAEEVVVNELGQDDLVDELLSQVVIPAPANKYSL